MCTKGPCRATDDRHLTGDPDSRGAVTVRRKGHTSGLHRNDMCFHLVWGIPGRYALT